MCLAIDLEDMDATIAYHIDLWVFHPALSRSFRGLRSPCKLLPRELHCAASSSLISNAAVGRLSVLGLGLIERCVCLASFPHQPEDLLS